MSSGQAKRPRILWQFPAKAAVYNEEDSDGSLPDLVTPDGRPLDFSNVSHVNLGKKPLQPKTGISYLCPCMKLCCWTPRSSLYRLYTH